MNWKGLLNFGRRAAYLLNATYRTITDNIIDTKEVSHE